MGSVLNAIKNIFSKDDTAQPAVDQTIMETKEEKPVAQADAPVSVDAPVVAIPEGLTPQIIEGQVIDILRATFDPEIPVNIYELGLIYNIDVSPTFEVIVKMTLTSPSCPVAETLPPDVENKIRGIPGVTKSTIDLVWDPPWDKDMMSEAAKLQLNMY